MYKEFNPFFSPEMDDFPIEITENIVSFLDDSSIGNLAKTSRRYRDITTNIRQKALIALIEKYRQELPIGTSITFTRPIYPNWPYSKDGSYRMTITGVVTDDRYDPEQRVHMTAVEGPDNTMYKLIFEILDDGSTKEHKYNPDGDIIIN